MHKGTASDRRWSCFRPGAGPMRNFAGFQGFRAGSTSNEKRITGVLPTYKRYSSVFAPKNAKITVSKKRYFTVLGEKRQENV
jgi:hypothetical protein